MRGAFRFGRIAEIELAVHWSFLLLLSWTAYQSVSGLGWTAGLLQVGFVLAVFGCVLLHEFGHAWAARSYGILTHSITMLPIGGLAQLDQIPRDPRQECVIAAAGPAVNVLIAGFLMPLAVLLSYLAVANPAFLLGQPYIERLAQVNLFLAAFNLLPTFPMDGGRMLRAFLARRIDYLQATQRARQVGMVVAALMAVVGLWLNPMLVGIAVFVVWAGGVEARSVEHEFQHPPTWLAQPVAVCSSDHSPYHNHWMVVYQHAAGQRGGIR
jgi:Zn-dependent protease